MSGNKLEKRSYDGEVEMSMPLDRDRTDKAFEDSHTFHCAYCGETNEVFMGEKAAPDPIVQVDPADDMVFLHENRLIGLHEPFDYQKVMGKIAAMNPSGAKQASEQAADRLRKSHVPEQTVGRNWREQYVPEARRTSRLAAWR